MRKFNVAYREYDFSDINYIKVVARSKEKAYYEALDSLEAAGIRPYSAWVEYSTDLYELFPPHYFKTCEGLSY